MLAQLLLIAAAAAQGPAADPPCAPLRIVLIQDLSGSGAVNLTPRLTVLHIDQVLRYLARCGGEIAVATISTDSRQPLLRFHAAPPPLAPAEVEVFGTAFQRERGRKSYLAAVARFRADSSAHADDLAVRSVAFRTAAERLLNGAAAARRSDIHLGIERAGLFLGEPTDTYPMPPISVVILASDADHNTSRRPGTLPVGSQLYLVNGQPTGSALDHLGPQRYEGLDAVLRHLLKRDFR